MDHYVNMLKAYLLENPSPSGNCQANSLLGMLYCCYFQCHNIENEQIKNHFDSLDSITSKLSAEESDQIFNISAALCEKYQQEAFCQGLLVGFRLFQELSQPSVS